MREIVTGFRHRKKGRHFRATKWVDIGVHGFYFMKGIGWWLFKISILPKKSDEIQERNI
jgi:hypothetical protein